MNQQNIICLSVEELAVTLSLLGRPEIGKGLLISEFGQINQEEERGRLSAATHTLMAKQVVLFQDDQLRLTVDFAKLVTPLINCDFSLRCSRKREGGPEQILIYYFRQSMIVKHTIQHSVLHQLGEIDDVDQVVKDTISFFDLDEIKLFSAATEQLTQGQLEEARQKATEGVNKIKDYLSQQGFSDEFSQPFAEDLCAADYRGSVMRVEISAAKDLTSNNGLMLLKGVSDHLWLLNIVPEAVPPGITILPATATEVREAIWTLSQ